MGAGSQVCCYVISTHYGTFYTGITNSIIRRWSEHNKGKSSYLRKFLCKEVIYIEFFDSRKLARKREVMIKGTGARRYLLKLIHRNKVGVNWTFDRGIKL